MKNFSAFRNILFFAAAALVLNQAVWAGGRSGTAGSSDAATVTMFSMWGDGEEALNPTNQWFADYLLDELGIRLELRSTPPGQLEQYVNTMVASNDMTDIFPFRDSTVIQNIVNSGKMLNLADHKDKLPDIFQNPLYEKAIAYYTENFGGPNKGFYCVPTNIGPNDGVDYKGWLRYDYYKEIGAPPINSLEDYLTVLKRMQDAHPQNDDGQRVYGFSLWNDWDKQSVAPATYIATTFGYDVEYVSHLCQTYVDGSKTPISILDDNGPYKRVLKFFFTANQMGLMDPNSATQNFSVASAKATAGRVLYAHWDWFGSFNSVENKNQGKGFMQVPWRQMKATVSPDLSTGQNWVFGIPANSKNRDAALKFFNFYCSIEGQDLMMNGPRGVIWDVDANGLRYVTDAGWKILETNIETNRFGPDRILGNGPLSGSTPNPATKGQKLNYGQWDSTILHNNNNTLYNTWVADHNGAADPGRWMISQGMTVKTLNATRMMPALPTDLENIMTQIGDVVKTNSWRAIFAKDEAEFDALWKDAQTKAAGLGMQRILDWTIQAWEGAKAADAKYR
jgi:putative aldouronate transport system substrate-binding protein